MTPDEAIANLTRSDVERFWSKVDRRSEDECWEWTASRRSDGYGQLNVRGTVVAAHRVALALALGHPPEHLAIHSCDNRGCVRPTHLRDGTYAENVADAISRGQHVGPPHPRGSDCSNAVFDEDTVREVRKRAASGESQSALAREFGVTHSSVNFLVHRLTWAHVA